MGGLERAEAIKFYRPKANADKAFAFKAYKNDVVKESLNTLFAFKCAYCESRYAAVHPVDVEHYRPKAGVVANGKVRKPGYYWLAAEWTNLLPSCIDCNRERTHTFPDGSKRKSGKGNNFPIVDEKTRARKPDRERGEGRLLLHPYFDDPDVHFSFDDEGIVKPISSRSRRQSRKGKESIRVYGLLRTWLVQERAALAKKIVASVARAEDLARVLQETGNATVEMMLRDELAALKGFREPDQPYSAMARHLTDDFLARMT